MSDINYMTWNLDFTRRLLTRTNNARFVQHDDSTDIVRVTVQGVDKSTSSASWNVLYKLENDDHIYKMDFDSSVNGDTTTLDWHVPASLLADDGAVGFVVCRKVLDNNTTWTDWNTTPAMFTVEPSYEHSGTVVPKETVDELTSALQKAVNDAKSTVDQLKNNTLKLSDAWKYVYPVGSIYMSVSSTSPATLFGGTWAALGGRFLIGADSTYSAGSTGGEATHTLTAAEMPAHKHNLSDDARAHSIYWGMKDADVHAGIDMARGTGTSNNIGTKQTDWATTGTAGKGQAHNNMPPYLSVYMWKRTA